MNLEDFSSTQRYILPLNRENTRTIDRTGGTFLHSSRTNPSKMKSVPDFLNADDHSKAEVTKSGSTFMAYDLSKKVLKTLEDLRLDYLVCIGGDDTLSYAARLHELGFKVIAIPKTMDNDVRNTEYCIGFSTAITRAKDAIQRQRTTIGSHQRIAHFQSLRPRCRAHFSLHGLRHFHPLLHPRVSLRCRQSGGPAAAR
ncbi:MAG: 6-phosphofructokinase [Bryobacterales bacterium]|nr:6-phosphofructokinase [Bryobacterales bacterium]